MPNVPNWAIDMISDVASTKTDVKAIKADVAEMKPKMHTHSNGLGGFINKRWFSLGLGIGLGLLGIGTGLVTLLTS